MLNNMNTNNNLRFLGNFSTSMNYYWIWATILFCEGRCFSFAF
ncbi:hypothetical protein BBUWI9123_J0001, partial (plasmid) [Borreliella burgdorferi WI91-23]